MNNAPFITTEGFYGTTSIDLEARHLTNGKIFLNGEITSQTADNFVKAFLYLKEKEEPVTIYINTPGGSVEAGLVIYDLIQGAKDMEIHMVCTGSASSMGAIILAGGQKGRRHILKHSKVMIHEPLISNGFGGSATSIQSISESIMDTKKILNKPATVQISKTSGLAGIAYWINQTYRLEGEEKLDKRSDLVVTMKDWVDRQYEEGRQTAMTDRELEEKIEELAPGRYTRV